MSHRRILVFPFDLMSHYLRCITLAKQYEGYEILFADSGKYSPYVKEAGYTTFPCLKFDSDYVMACARKFDFSWLKKEAIERIFLAQVEIINTLKPDFVIGDTSPTLKMAAEKCGVKYIALMNGYMSKYYAETRTLSRTHPGYKHLSKLPPSFSNKITRFAERIAFRAVHKPFRKLRKKYKLRPVPSYLNEMEGDENLICDEPSLFPQKDLPENYRVIGPLIYQSDQDDKEVLEQIDESKSTICVCMGSSGNWEKLKFLSDSRFSVFNIITAGDIKEEITGSHIISRNFVNLDAVLPHCKYMICHGGNGTIYFGLKHKTPMLCLTDHFEQEWNVQRVEALGYGQSIDEDPEAMVVKNLL